MASSQPGNSPKTRKATFSIASIDTIHQETAVVLMRFALSSLLVLAIALPSGLENPYWGLLTVGFLSLRYDSGELWAKSIARIIGTLTGAIVGTALTLYLAPHPLWLIVTISIWMFACAVFTSIFQFMAGYGGFLAGMTALLVVTNNIDTSNTTAIIYYAVFRTSEISLGIIAITVSAALIFPTPQHQKLASMVEDLKQSIDVLTHGAFYPGRMTISDFIEKHKSTCLKAVRINQQRYYASILDPRIGRVGGTIDNMVMESLACISVLLVIRRMRLKELTESSNPPTEMPIDVLVQRNEVYAALKRKVADNNKTLSEIHKALLDPLKLSQLPRQAADDHSMRQKAWRQSIYHAVSVGVTVVVGFIIWVVTQQATAPLIIITGAIMANLRIIRMSSSISLKDMMAASLFCGGWGFFIEFIILIHLDDFWHFYLTFFIAYAVPLAMSYRDPNALFPTTVVLVLIILMPVENTLPFDAFGFINNWVAVTIGFFIAFLTVEVIGAPDKERLIRDNIQHLDDALLKIRTGKPISISDYRHLILSHYLDILELEVTDQPELIITWFNALNIMGVSQLRLKDAELSSEQEALLAALKQLQAYHCLNLCHPAVPDKKFDDKSLSELDALIHQAENLIELDNSRTNILIFLFGISIRRYYLISSGKGVNLIFMPFDHK